MINDIKAEHLNALFPAILKLINSLPQNDALKIIDVTIYLYILYFLYRIMKLKFLLIIIFTQN